MGVISTPSAISFIFIFGAHGLFVFASHVPDSLPGLVAASGRYTRTSVKQDVNKAFPCCKRYLE